MAVLDTYDPVYNDQFGGLQAELTDTAETVYWPVGQDVPLILTIFSSPPVVVTDPVLLDGRWVFTYPKPDKGVYAYRYLVQRPNGSTYLDRGLNDEGEIIFPQRPLAADEA
jgi:hypothetical protein